MSTSFRRTWFIPCLLLVALPVAVRSARSPEHATTFIGLRTAIYHVGDIDAAKMWYTEALGVAPYFDESFYVGFDVGGFELGLDPDTTEAKPGPGGTVAYWSVANADSALAHLLRVGARPNAAVQDVGGGTRVASVLDPFGNVLGIIESPADRP